MHPRILLYVATMHDSSESPYPTASHLLVYYLTLLEWNQTDPRALYQLRLPNESRYSRSLYIPTCILMD